MPQQGTESPLVTQVLHVGIVALDVVGVVLVDAGIAMVYVISTSFVARSNLFICQQ